MGSKMRQRRQRGNVVPEMEKIQRGSRQERLQPFSLSLCGPEKRGRGASGRGGSGEIEGGGGGEDGSG